MTKHFPVLVVTFLCLIGRSNAQPGSLDMSFGQGGKIVTDINDVNNLACATLIQPDGKVIVIGSSSSGSYQGYFSLVRYKTDGSIDQSFGVNGFVETHLNYDEAHAQAGLLQPDGKIVVAGYAWSGGNYDFVIMRYTSAGKRDLTFGSGGLVLTDFAGKDDKVNSLAFLPNGNILAGGSTEEIYFFEMDAAFACYDQNGSLNTSFGTSGKAVCSISESGLFQSINGLVIQSDGKILAGGYTEYHQLVNNTYTEAFLLIRLLPDGTMDPTFGNMGSVETLIGAHSIGKSVAVDGGGKILLLGKASLTSGGNDEIALLRYNDDGVLDGNFGDNGMVITTFDNTNDVGNCLLVQPDQKIIAAGFTALTDGSPLNFALVRYLANGTLDNSFGLNGKVTTDFYNDWDLGTSVAIQKNGKVIVGGYAKFGNDYDFAVARYMNDDALPVKLEKFLAEKEAESVYLRWQTSFEDNSDYFEIQRSDNGKEWHQIGSIPAISNSDSAINYVFVDNLPMKSNLYRLKMVDVDSKFTFSSIQYIYFEDGIDNKELKIFPNPASSKLTIETKNNLTIKDINILGSNGIVTPAKLLNHNEINIEKFDKGFYYILVNYTTGDSECRAILFH
ncbi:T9SS type A sorting domain-containing protein [Dyadobacter sp. CY347]|uniref:T9SS type A sorting domain-containing protein n=1 Tax=Dyadobacter sp. CY347 TaxID=2909336 RepID=UPI001F267313|nr:T9SS type A sorting domain-containing protein [Dyadobacter sp. CY347]MCF2490706.1 hypothetical protein [Dyadobacter sp. CY347]